MQRIMRDLERFITPAESSSPRLRSLLLVGAGGNGGAGATALAASWAASQSSKKGHTPKTIPLLAFENKTIIF